MKDNMEITYKLESFEGPLDLLVHLIEKNKIDIYDIPIVMITKQYMDYMETMDKADLDKVSSFIVMAAMLLRIKSKMLLPKEEVQQEEEADPRDELVERLLEYQMFKMLSSELKDRQLLAEQSFYKKKNIPKEVGDFKEKPDLDKLLENITLGRLKEVFEEVMKRSEEKLDPIRSQFGKIEKETISLSERMTELRQQLSIHSKLSFAFLLGQDITKPNIIVTFLAVLELMKLGSIHIEQEKLFGEIQIESIKG